MPDEAVTLTAEFVRNENYFALNDALTTAKGYTYQSYSKESFANLTDAINTAKSALVNTITEEESLRQISLLQAAIEGLEEKFITKIAVTTLPSKTKYLEEKDLLDITGGRVTLYYDNNTSQTISLQDSMVTGFDNTKVGKQELTVSYQGFETTFEIEILEQPKSISGEVTFFGEGEATLKLIQNGEIIQTVTTENGAYLFEEIYAGDYTIEISKANHVAKIFDLTIEREDVNLDFDLYIMGDVNNDGAIMIADAVLILRVLNENLDAQYINKAAADMVGDDCELTTADAIAILRYLVSNISY